MHCCHIWQSIHNTWVAQYVEQLYTPAIYLVGLGLQFGHLINGLWKGFLSLLRPAETTQLHE